MSARSIRRYRRQQPARPPSLAWPTFLHNQIAGIWAADLLVVQTLTFKTLYVLFFIEHRANSWSCRGGKSPSARWAAALARQVRLAASSDGAVSRTQL